MRMRKRHNLEPRMGKCKDYLVEEPGNKKGSWRTLSDDCSCLCLELGCGKGRFTVETASGSKDMLLIAVEKVPDAMIVAMERAKNANLTNVRFIDEDAANLKEMFSDGEIDRIYINFCDPWPKSRDAKFRLTAPSFLRIYSDLLPEGGQIHFKTDNTPLFDWSVKQFEAEGWILSNVTHDLHSNGPCGVMTDYEAKFYSQGLKINRLEATKAASTLGCSAGPVPRLRNASLTDARGFEESTAAAEYKDDNREVKEE